VEKKLMAERLWRICTITTASAVARMADVPVITAKRWIKEWKKAPRPCTCGSGAPWTICPGRESEDEDWVNYCG